mmetsp:Transcript_18909/g.37220  ORF Transcript_18909/g.37220 Transcript_18909/m.37220 type:complete len:80 (-) Transcript_18909:266-505(-)
MADLISWAKRTSVCPAIKIRLGQSYLRFLLRTIVLTKLIMPAMFTLATDVLRSSSRRRSNMVCGEAVKGRHTFKFSLQA